MKTLGLKTDNPGNVSLTTLLGFFNLLQMSDLIKIVENNGNKAVSARELYEFLGFDKSNWSRWLKKNISDNDFAIENVDYVGFVTMTNGNETQDFALSIDFAKKLSMMAKTEKGEQARNYFIECEKALQKSLPSTYKEALLALVVAEEEKERLALQVENLDTVLDSLLEWVSIIKIAKHNKIKETTFDWHVLKKASIELGYQIKKAESPRFGYQNLYHINVFKRCYPALMYDLKK